MTQEIYSFLAICHGAHKIVHRNAARNAVYATVATPLPWIEGRAPLPVLPDPVGEVVLAGPDVDAEPEEEEPFTVKTLMYDISK